MRRIDAGCRAIAFPALGIAAILAGCARLETPDDATAEARRQMALAESLEQKSLLREAAHQYAMVAERFPLTPEYPRALRQAGLLSASPLNQARDDSAALRWLTLYQSLPASEGEREMLSIILGSLAEQRALQARVTRLTTETDSLYALAKRHAALLLSHSSRVQALEETLRRTTAELEKLKAIDARTTRGRRRPTP